MRVIRSVLASIVIPLMVAALVSVTTFGASAAAQVNAPSNTNAISVSDGRIDVSWQDNSTNETGFEVHRSATGSAGVFTLVATTTANVTARTDTGLNPSTQYCYKARAFITVGSGTSYSDFSNTACATTLAPPPPPGQLVVMNPWAADGSLIGDRTDHGPIYIINLNDIGTGTGAMQLTANPGWDAEPSWSPDGSKIAFTSDRDGNDEIYVMNADGSAPMRLTSDPAADYSPAWSPDGTRIAFVSNRGDGVPTIYVMNADGSNPVPLTNGRDPAWSPDGRRIAFAGDRWWEPAGPRGIFVMNADGSGITRLTAPENSDAQPAWSPDGVKIAFVRSECCSHEFGQEFSLVGFIYVMNADGSGVTMLTWDYFDDHSDPAWSPDGRKIAFSNSGLLMIVNADGTNRVFLGWGYYGLSPAWRP